MPGWTAFSAATRISENLAEGSYSASTSQSSLAGNAATKDVEQRIEKQNLIIQTLLMILIEKNVLHEDEFKEWMIYVDELDGKRDGKLSDDRSPVVCSKCKRNNAPGRSSCQYCGEEFPPEFLMHVRKEK